MHHSPSSSFQSLFLWNSRPDDTRQTINIHLMRVSILVFVELAPGRWLEGVGCKADLVSILVFVELAPGLTSYGRSAQPKFVSILVFVELAPGPHGRSRVSAAVRFVSILVFVELAPGLSCQG